MMILQPNHSYRRAGDQSMQHSTAQHSTAQQCTAVALQQDMYRAPTLPGVESYGRKICVKRCAGNVLFEFYLGAGPAQLQLP